MIAEIKTVEEAIENADIIWSYVLGVSKIIEDFDSEFPLQIFATNPFHKTIESSELRIKQGFAVDFVFGNKMQMFFGMHRSYRNAGLFVTYGNGKIVLPKISIMTKIITRDTRRAEPHFESVFGAYWEFKE